MYSTIVLPIILLTLPSLLLGTYVTVSARRRRRTPPELQGDWWARFESEFRAYAARVANSADHCPRRSRGERYPPRRT
jgi:hypothetical protein